jgi:hypothetical protein
MDHQVACDAVGMLCEGLSFACLHSMQVNGYMPDQEYSKPLRKRPKNFCEMVGSLHLSKSLLVYKEKPKFLYNKYLYICII